jgi:phage gp36-like protein
MGYIIQADLIRTIQDVNLQQIISNDATILDRAILSAEAEAKSYLRQKYKLDSEFTDTNLYDGFKTYYANDRIRDTLGDIYFAKLPCPAFTFNGSYKIGDQTFWNNKIYTCRVPTSTLTHEAALQYGFYQNIPLNNVAPDDVVNGLQYWGVGTLYYVPAGTPVTNTSYWIIGDNRDAQMVMFIIDVALFHLHSRIAPRNIPELRVKRYDAAIEWFRFCAEGKITPALELIQPKQGNRIRYGGNVKNINNY